MRREADLFDARAEPLPSQRKVPMSEAHTERQLIAAKHIVQIAGKFKRGYCTTAHSRRHTL